MVVTDHIRVMLHLESSLQHFTPKPISDPARATGVVVCLDCDGKEQVDGLVANAVAGGATLYDDAHDLGFVYTHGFLDPDGHAWRLNAMSHGHEG